MFSYIEMLRKAGPQRWVFDELAAVAEQRFRFAEDEEASEFVSRLAASLPLYAPKHALNGSYLHEEWRPELVSSRCRGQDPAPLHAFKTGARICTAAFEHALVKGPAI